MPAYAIAHLHTPQINDDVLDYIERIQDTLGSCPTTTPAPPRRSCTSARQPDVTRAQNSGTPGSWPASTAPAAVSVSGLTRKCWVIACASRSRRWSGWSL